MSTADGPRGPRRPSRPGAGRTGRRPGQARPGAKPPRRATEDVDDAPRKRGENTVRPPRGERETLAKRSTGRPAGKRGPRTEERAERDAAPRRTEERTDRRSARRTDERPARDGSRRTERPARDAAESRPRRREDERGDRRAPRRDEDRPVREGPRRPERPPRASTESRPPRRSEERPAREDTRRPARSTRDAADSRPRRRDDAAAAAPTRRRSETVERRPRPAPASRADAEPRPSTNRPVRVPKPRDPAAAPAAGASEKAREGDRIAKLLARAGVASRRDIERMIAEGRIALNGEVLTTPATVLTSLHGVTVDGNPVQEPSPARLFLFYKPVGYLTAARDPQGRPTIYDRLPEDLPRLMPVGRLDFNTEGLLLLTTDGGLKRQLELPSSGIERTYRARAFGTVTQDQLEDLIEGVEIEGMRYGRIDANLERRTGRNQWIEMTITEGKNREVRRVLEHLGLDVNRLIRTRYGRFTLDDAQPGDIVEVRQADLIAFRKTLK